MSADFSTLTMSVEELRQQARLLSDDMDVDGQPLGDSPFQAINAQRSAADATPAKVREFSKAKLPNLVMRKAQFWTYEELFDQDTSNLGQDRVPYLSTRNTSLQFRHLFRDNGPYWVKAVSPHPLRSAPC